MTTRSFEHGKKAFGAKYIRDGFAWTAEEDLAFALGFPYVTALVDGHPDDEVKDLDELENLVVSKSYVVEIPRQIAIKRARVFPVLRVGASGEVNKDVVVPLLKRTDPITRDEARSIIAKAIASASMSLSAVLRMLQILEAIAGPSDVADAIVTALETLSDDALQDSTSNALFARFLGFSRLRVTVAEAGALDARLAKLRDRLPKPGRRSAREALDIIAGQFQRSPDDGVFINDDPKKALSLLTKPNPTFGPNGRFVFVAGDAVFDWYTTYVKKMDKHRQPDVVPHFSPMRSEKALSFLLLMSAASSVKKIVVESFVARAEHTRPFLEKKSASKGDEAAWAKAILAKLSGSATRPAPRPRTTSRRRKS